MKRNIFLALVALTIAVGSVVSLEFGESNVPLPEQNATPTSSTTVVWTEETHLAYLNEQKKILSNGFVMESELNSMDTVVYAERPAESVGSACPEETLLERESWTRMRFLITSDCIYYRSSSVHGTFTLLPIKDRQTFDLEPLGNTYQVKDRYYAFDGSIYDRETGSPLFMLEDGSLCDFQGKYGGYEIRDGHVFIKAYEDQADGSSSVTYTKTELPISHCEHVRILEIEEYNRATEVFQGPTETYVVQYERRSVYEREDANVGDVFFYKYYLDTLIPLPDISTNGEWKRIGTSTYPFIYTNSDKVFRIDINLADASMGCGVCRYEVREIVGADPDTFELLGKTIGRDAGRVYFMTEPLPDLDQHSLKIIADNRGGFESGTFVFLQDKDSLWLNGESILALNPGAEVKIIEVTTYVESMDFTVGTQKYRYTRGTCWDPEPEPPQLYSYTDESTTELSCAGAQALGKKL